ncbi:MAG TPA: hypothetical protein VIY51_14730 [Xanthobacteraceae bacterium]
MIRHTALATIMQQCYCMSPNGQDPVVLNIAFRPSEFAAAKSLRGWPWSAVSAAAFMAISTAMLVSQDG